MAVCAQNRWNDSIGATPVASAVWTFDHCGSFLYQVRMSRNETPGLMTSPLGILPDQPEGTKIPSPPAT